MEQQRDYMSELFKRCDNDFTISDNYNNNLLNKLEESNKPVEVKIKNKFLNFFYKKKEGFSLIFSGVLIKNSRIFYETKSIIFLRIMNNIGGLL